MGSLRRRLSPGPDRFLGFFVHPEASANGVELHEDEVLWNGSGSPEPNPNPNHIPNLSPKRTAAAVFHERSAGILAFLLDDDEKRGGASGPFLRRSPLVSVGWASTSPDSSRLAPAMPEGPHSLPSRKMYQQSAPVSVPVPVERRSRPSAAEMYGGGDGDDEDEEMLPPHEIVARSPMAVFSVLEGAGRTLKGRDLRRVRNAVWRQTGYLD